MNTIYFVREQIYNILESIQLIKVCIRLKTPKSQKRCLIQQALRWKH